MAADPAAPLVHPLDIRLPHRSDRERGSSPPAETWRGARGLVLWRPRRRRGAETREIGDGGLCHGAAGLGHLFNRMYQATGETMFLREAHASFELLLEMRRPGDGVAGYSALFPRDKTGDGWEDNASLLTGAAGIALAFLAAATDIEPAWDRLLMASIRPGSIRKIDRPVSN